MDAAIGRFKANPCEQTYKDVFACLSETVVTLVEGDCWYAFRNKGRGKFYWKNISSRLTSSTSLISSSAAQHFRFLRAEDDGYYVQSGRDMSYLSPTGSDSRQLTLVEQKADAGIYRVIPSLNGQSLIVCRNPAGSHAYLSLNEACDKVLPAAPTEAARWFIEATTFVPTRVEKTVAENDVNNSFYDLSGRRTNGEGKGFFIMGNKKILKK